MKRTIMKPRLLSLEVFASALLVSLGVEMQAGCSTEVTVEGNGGAGGSNTSSSSSGNSTVTSSGSSSTSSSSSSSTGFIPGTGECINPQPIVVDGIDVGVDICAGGEYLRREAVDCPPGVPDSNPCCGVCPVGTICDTGEVACQCVPICVKDSDCTADQLCLCGPHGGRCETAKCRTGGAPNCPTGQSCTSWDSTQGCLYLSFACTTPQDTCAGDKDCNSQVPFSFCTVQADGHRECQVGGCAIGKPFLVDGEARTAGIEERNDWCEKDITPNIVGLNERIRDELATAWEHTAKMEHASIAAFARFSLELLSLGAPSELIMRTNSALVDETKHARVAFALASVYRGKRVGPGRLAMDGAMADGDDITSFVRRVIREGCVGETVAAVEAGEAAARANDPLVRQTLEMIAADESEHAELAWRTVKWALDTFGADVRETIHEEMARLADELATVYETRRTARDEELLDHGVVTAGVRGSIRRAAFKQVVVPCLGALLGVGSRAASCGSRAFDGQRSPTRTIRTGV